MNFGSPLQHNMSLDFGLGNLNSLLLRTDLSDYTALLFCISQEMNIVIDTEVNSCFNYMLKHCVR